MHTIVPGTCSDLISMNLRTRETTLGGGLRTSIEKLKRILATLTGLGLLLQGIV